MRVGIVDVGIGNLGSIKNALYNMGKDFVGVSAPSDLLPISHLILPGVGSFASAMDKLKSMQLIDPIRTFAKQGKPILGICLGMQILGTRGTEGGSCPGLDLVPGRIELMRPRGVGLRIPHVGWNEVCQKYKHPLLKGVRDKVDFYFVHGYRFYAEHEDHILAETEYGEWFPSLIGFRNIVGAQFHPEKSQSNGIRLLENFCLWGGEC